MLSHLQLINLQIMVEALLAGHLIAIKLERKPHYWLRLFSSFLVCCLLIVCIPVIESPLWAVLISGTLIYSSVVILLLSALMFCYSETHWTMLFCAVSGYTMQHLLSSVNTGIAALESPFITLNPSLTAVQYVAQLLIVYGLCYATVCKAARTIGHIVVENQTMIVLTAVALCTDIIVSLYVFQLKQSTPSRPYALLLALYDVTVCICMLYLLFELAVNRSLRDNNTTMLRLLEEQRKQYALSNQLIEQVNIKTHDLKHTAALYAQLQSPDTNISNLATNHRIQNWQQRAQVSAIQELQSTVQAYDALYHTGSDALDIVLAQKHTIMQQCHIELSCMADGAALQQLPPQDMYVLFGNVLDNAIEAVQHILPEPERLILITVRRQGNMVLIHEENPYIGQINYAYGLPITTKENSAQTHGFGTQSMRHIVEAHHGTLAFSDNEGWFNVDITIPVGSNA